MRAEQPFAHEKEPIMLAPLRLNATVLSGHRIEVTAPELPEGAEVQLIVTDSHAPANTSPYPSALEAEYEALIEKEMHGTLTAAEARRLAVTCQIIAAIDSITLGNDVRALRLDQLQHELSQIQAEVDLYPNLP